MNTINSQIDAVAGRARRIAGDAGVGARMGRTSTWYGQHARLAADAIRAHLWLQQIKFARLTGAATALEAPVHAYGTIALLNLAEEVNGVARIDDVLVRERHYLRQYWVRGVCKCVKC